MTNREIKEMLKNAYTLSESQNEKRFVRKYEKRSLQILEIIKLETRYMGVQSIMSGMVFTVLMWMIAKTENTDLIWAVSSMIPVCAMVPMILLSRSERNGMFELEASTRFSLRFVRLVRMFIVGIITMGLFSALGIVLKAIAILSGADYLIMVVIPYLVSDLGAMTITRKWNKRDNIVGIFMVCVFSCFLPFVIKEIRFETQFPNVALGICIIMLVVLVVRECILYVKESENLTWNLC